MYSLANAADLEKPRQQLLFLAPVFLFLQPQVLQEGLPLLLGHLGQFFRQLLVNVRHLRWCL